MHRYTVRRCVDVAIAIGQRQRQRRRFTDDFPVAVADANPVARGDVGRRHADDFRNRLALAFAGVAVGQRKRQRRSHAVG